MGKTIKIGMHKPMFKLAGDDWFFASMTISDSTNANGTEGYCPEEDKEKPFDPNGKRRIDEVTDDSIWFDDGSWIKVDHWQDCCEVNYADFDQLDSLARDYVFVGKIEFEEVPGSGFRFGDSRRKFFVPCYSEQNGYYNSSVDVTWYDDNRKALSGLGVECEMILR